MTLRASDLLQATFLQEYRHLCTDLMARSARAGSCWFEICQSMDKGSSETGLHLILDVYLRWEMSTGQDVIQTISLTYFCCAVAPPVEPSCVTVQDIA